MQPFRLFEKNTTITLKLFDDIYLLLLYTVPLPVRCRVYPTTVSMYRIGIFDDAEIGIMLIMIIIMIIFITSTVSAQMLGE